VSRRLHYVDWLRVIAVLLLFPFHSARVFDIFEPFYAKSSNLSQFLSWVVVGWLGIWQMPLFFLVAGSSAYFALNKRSAREFLSERVLRLLVPFVFGVLVLVPPQNWYGAQTNAHYTGSFWEYLASGMFFHVSLESGADYYGSFGFGQMWFVLFLFVLSAVALPFFLWARPGRPGERFAAGAARRLARPQWWWVGVLALMLTQPLPDVIGKDLFLFLGLIVLGYLAMADEPRFTADAKRWGWWAAGLGLALSVAVPFVAPIADAAPDPSFTRAGFDLIHMGALWLLLLGFLGLGARFLDRRSSALDYLSEAGYPLYILHQTVIVALAFYLVRLPFGWSGQYVLVLATATAVTFALYEGVRRVAALRWLFGMKTRTTPARQTGASR
jgi:glucans biosynthesis protein C